MMKRSFWLAMLAILLMAGSVGFAASQVEADGLVRVARAEQRLATNPPPLHFPLVLYHAYDCNQTPTLVAPANGEALDTLIPLFQWDSGRPIYASIVQMHVAKSPDFTNLVKTMGSSDVQGEGSFRYPNNFDPGTTYYWRMRFRCQNNVTGPWTDVWHFTTGQHGVILPAPVLLSPPNGSVIEETPVELKWEAVDGAVMYQVSWRKAGVLGKMYGWTTQTSLHPFGIQQGNTYEWWVAAVNDYAVGEASLVWQFTMPSE